MRITVFSFLLLIALSCIAQSAQATNGMKFICYGGRESGMGGASYGLSDNVYAMNNNPAGLTEVKFEEIRMGLTLGFPIQNHKDVIGNDMAAEYQVFPLPMMGYTKHISDKFAIGIGFFAHGGLGAEYQDMATAFGTTDYVKADVGYYMITPTIAYKLNDVFSFGLSMQIGHSYVSMDLFPGTYVDGVFNGMRLDDATSIGFRVKAGVQAHINDQFTLGFVYTSKPTMNYEGGTIYFASDSQGYDAAVDDFGWPQSLGFGAAYKVNDKLTLAADITWLQWSDSLDVVTVTVEEGAPQEKIELSLNWDDQFVFAIGAEYKLSEKLYLRAGYNYGKNPIPGDGLSPMFSIITEHHLTIGIEWFINEHWSMDLSYGRGFENEVTYTNPDMPFGPNAVETMALDDLHIFFNFRF